MIPGSAPSIPGVFMVDDNSLATAAMERRFAGSTELRWLGSTGDASKVIPMVLELRPAVVLLDVEMPGVDSFELLRRLVAQVPAVATVMFSGHDEAALVNRALGEGAAGYIHKDESTALIAAMLRRAAGGECVLSPLVARTFMRSATGKDPGIEM